MTDSATVRADDAVDPSRVGHSWAALVALLLAQLMITLDMTIVSIALPTIQQDLGVGAAERQWVLTAYTLAFGALLLLGGRAADHLGHRSALVVALVGFAAASATGGGAGGLWLLLVARAAQGMFAALLAPAALAALHTTFTAGPRRAVAFAMFGAISAVGAAIGLVLGGVLTEFLTWRWVLYVNVPIAALAAIGVLVFLPGGRRRPNRYDPAGAVLATAGLVAVVYGFTEAARRGWTSAPSLVPLGAGLLLLVLFALVEARVRAPMLPLRLVADRTRGGANLAMLLTSAGMLGVFLYLTFYLQQVSGLSPAMAGVASLPVSAGVVVGSAATGRLLVRVAPRLPLAAGLLFAAAGMALLTRLDVRSGYLVDVLPSLLLVGIGLGAVFGTVFHAALWRVDPADAGVAAGTLNAADQVGGSLGVALLNTIAAGGARAYLAEHPDSAVRAQAHGYAVGSAWAAGILAAAAVLVYVLVDARRLGSPAAPEWPTPPTAE